MTRGAGAIGTPGKGSRYVCGVRVDSMKCYSQGMEATHQTPP